MASSAPPQPIVTPDNFSSIPSIISWFTAVVVGLCVLTKIWTKLSMTRKFAADDVAHLIAMVFSIGMVVAVSLQSQNGLGRPEAEIAAAQLEAFEKSAFASGLLYIATLFFSKASVLVLLKALTPVKIHVLMIYAVTGFMAVWTVSSVVVVAFQCSVPSTWALLNTSKCIDETAFWIYFGVVNIITEIFLVALPAAVMSKVQIAREKRVLISLVFGMRVLVIAAIVAELVFTAQVNGSSDRTLSLWPVVVCQLFVQCLSIAFACAPYLKPFFASLESGMIRMDDTRRREGRSVRSYPLKSGEKLSSSDKRSSQNKTSTIIAYPMKTWTQITRGGQHPGDEHELNVERVSQRSDSRIINTSTTIEIHTEGVNDSYQQR